jgi:hypothetical protein
MQMAGVLLALSACTAATDLGEASVALSAPGDPRYDLVDATTRIEFRAAQADAFHIFSDSLRLRPDGDYDLLSEPFIHLGGATSHSPALCTDASFYGQPRTFFIGTGILVGEDLLLLPRHTMGNDEVCAASNFIFDHAVTGAPGPSETVFPIVPAEDVFSCAEIVAFVPGEDWSVVRLDRPIEPERIPLKVRRSGVIASGAALLLAGHPHRLPLKLEQTTATFGSSFWVSGRGTINFGSSGSMMLNLETHRVEGLVTSGGWGAPIPDPVLPCVRECVSSSCPNSFSGTSAGRFAVAIPPIGLEVSPVSADHYGPPGGPFSNAVVPTSLRVGATGRAVTPTAVSSSAITISPAVFPAIPPGGTFEASALLNAGVAAVLPIGVHVSAPIFTDNTYATRDPRIHRIHVGVDGLLIYDPTEPNDPIRYGLVNRWIVSNAVDASVDVPWLEINGKGTTAHILLPPIDPTERATPLALGRNHDLPPPLVGSIGTLTIRYAWQTEIRRVQWSGARLVPIP